MRHGVQKFGSKDVICLDFETDDIRELKEQLFREKVKLSEERATLDSDKAAFEAEKQEVLLRLEERKTFARVQAKRIEMSEDLVKQKLEIIHDEYSRLVRERARLENERKAFEARRAAGVPTVNKTVYTDTGILFSGVDSSLALKKRYRELMKIFHPDNTNVDSDVIQSITDRYNELKSRY